MKNQTTFTKVRTSESYQEQLNILDEKISKIGKQISYLDAYNIVAVCDNKDTFAAQVNALTANSSLVINTQGFVINNVRYETGDLILKMANEEVVHIKAQTGGIFYPQSLTKTSDGSYTLSYAFSASKPTTIESTGGGFAQKINFELESSDTGSVYGIWEELNPTKSFKYYTFNVESVKEDGTIETIQKRVEPYIKFYLKESQEEIIVDYQIVDSKDSFTIELNDPIPNIWIKVK